MGIACDVQYPILRGRGIKAIVTLGTEVKWLATRLVEAEPRPTAVKYRRLSVRDFR